MRAPRVFRRLTRREMVAKELATTDEALLEATSNREYFEAMELMLSARRRRLVGELTAADHDTSGSAA